MALTTFAVLSQDVISSDRYYDERLRGTGAVTALDSDNLFGESISLKDGGVEFSRDDVVVPTNSGLRLAFGRQTPKHPLGLDNASMPLGTGWELNVPYMVARYDNRRGWQVAQDLGRCSAPGLGPTGSVGPAPDYSWRVMPTKFYWTGIHINIPGAGFEKLLTPTPGNPSPTDGTTYIGSTQSNWRLSCLPALKRGSGEGFVVHLPNGQKHYFDWMATRDTPDVLANPYYKDQLGNGTAPPYLLVPTSDYFLYATKVVDRFGNQVLYNYDPANPHRLTSIVSSEGPRIDIGYGSNGKVATVRADTRTWTYRYDKNYVDASRFGERLAEVALPDNTKWTYSGDILSWKMTSLQLPGSFYGNGCGQDATDYRQSDPENSAHVRTVVVEHPSGAVGEFKLRALIHGSDNTPGGCDVFGTSMSDFHFGSFGIPNAYLAMSLVSRKLTGAGGVNLAWSYLYSPHWSFVNACLPACTTTTTVTEPSGVTTAYVFGNSYTDNLGDLLSETVSSGGVVRKTTTYARKGSTGDFATTHGTPVPGAVENPLQYRIRPVQTTRQAVDSVQFTRTVNAFDAFARPLRTTRSNSLGYTRTDATEYVDNTALWVLGQPKTSTNLNTGLVESRADYDAATALPIRTYAFGKLQQTLTWNPDGTLATVKDGNGNVTTLGNYKRGIAQSIRNADGTSRSAVVNDAGWIAAAADETGATRQYTYDAMGRLASFVQPAGDSTAWNPTTQVFQPVSASEYGIAAGHWRQIVSTGNARKETYFDALWRPLLVREYDTADVAGTQRFTAFGYDFAGRTTFASYPVGSASSVAGITAGVRTVYDALGRPTRVTQDSELGPLVTTTEYLPGAQTRVTNPRGQATTTGYLFYDAPTYDWPTRIDQPEGVRTDIARDVFGKPTSITRSGPGG